VSEIIESMFLCWDENDDCTDLVDNSFKSEFGKLKKKSI